MGLLGGKKEYLNDMWIKKNTKKCPDCKTDIEKNQGCMHMTCRNCRNEFCWMCLGSWKEHGTKSGGYFKCNFYKESAVSKMISLGVADGLYRTLRRTRRPKK